MAELSSHIGSASSWHHLISRLVSEKYKDELCGKLPQPSCELTKTLHAVLTLLKATNQTPLKIKSIPLSCITSSYTTVNICVVITVIQVALCNVNVNIFL